MAVAFRNKTDQSGTSAGGTGAKPTGTANGDWVIVVLSKGSVAAVTPPSGWTNPANAAGVAGKYCWDWIYYRVIDGTETWPLAFAWTGSIGWNIVVATYSGTPVVDVVPNYADGSSSTATCASITTTVANACLIMVAIAPGSDNNWSAWTSPLTERSDYGAVADGIGLADGIQTGAGASGTKSATSVVNNDWDAWMMAIREGAVARNPVSMGFEVY